MKYWLLKSEPNVWSIADQKKAGLKGATWDGVRNYQAANNLKKMSKGDFCFFYHSNIGKEIVGIVEVIKTAFVDPTDKEKKISYVEKCLGKSEGPIMAASDYMRMNSDQIRPYTNKSFYSLGTDGFGRSDTRKKLRKFFEVDKEHFVTYSLSILAKEQLIASKYAKEAIKKYNIDGNKPMPTKL